MHLVRFEDPFGERLLAAEYDLRDVFDFGPVAAAYGKRWRISIRLGGFPDDRLGVIVGMIEAMTTADGGTMWEIEDSVLLVTPPEVDGPPEPTSGGGPNDDPSGDRSPRIPVRPIAAGAIERPPPDEPG